MPTAGTRVSARLLNLSGRYPRISTPVTKAHAKLFEKSGGSFFGRWFGSPILVVETVGRKSGELRSAPVIYMPDGDNMVVVAANGGNNRTPNWWLNLREMDAAEVVVAGERMRVRHRVAQGAEREDLWRRFARGYPGLDSYDTFTTRELPVIVFERLD